MIQNPIPIYEDGNPNQFAKDALKFLSERYNQFKSQRDDRSGDGFGFSFEDKFRQTDYMWHCGRSRSIMTTETQTVGTRTEEDKVPRADTGSKMFFRSTIFTTGRLFFNIKQRDGAELPWRYVRPKNKSDQEYISEQAYEDTNTKASSVARYGMDKDKYNDKASEFAMGMSKYGNMPVLWCWKQREREVLVRGKDGGKRKTKKIKEEYFSLEPMDITCVWADAIGGQISGQECAMYSVDAPIHTIHAQKDDFDPEGYKQFWKMKSTIAKHVETESDAKENRNVNRGGEEVTRDIDSVWSLWYAYAHLPMIDDNIADEDSDPNKVKYELIRFTLAGISPTQSSIILAAERDTTPDDQIPIDMIWLFPDEDKGKLYHIMPVELIRSDYAASTAFMNMAIDNGREINEPKRAVNSDIMQTLNMDDDIWYVDGDVSQAVQEFRPENIIQPCLLMKEATQKEGESALVMSDNTAGQSYGARTTANEAILIDRFRSMADAVVNGYGAEMFLRKYGAKTRQYWATYASKALDIEVSGSEWVKIESDDLWGDYEVSVEVIDNEEQDALTIRAMDTLVGIVAQTPNAQKSDTHMLDWGEMLRVMFRSRGMYRAPTFILPAGNEDARAVAGVENDVMNQGQQAQVEQGQNHDVHNSVHRPQLQRVIDALAVMNASGENDTEVAQQHRVIASVFQIHIQEHDQMSQQEKAQQASVSANGGTLQGQGNAQNAGQVLQGELGAQSGGAVV